MAMKTEKLFRTISVKLTQSIPARLSTFIYFLQFQYKIVFFSCEKIVTDHTLQAIQDEKQNSFKVFKRKVRILFRSKLYLFKLPIQSLIMASILQLLHYKPGLPVCSSGINFSKGNSNGFFKKHFCSQIGYYIYAQFTTNA